MHNDCMAKKKSSDVNITAFEILKAVTGQPPTTKCRPNSARKQLPKSRDGAGEIRLSFHIGHKWQSKRIIPLRECLFRIL